MANDNGQVFMVHRPEDGMVVPLTCTQTQFDEVWAPKGYTLANDAESQEVSDDSAEGRSTAKKGGSGKAN